MFCAFSLVEPLHRRITDDHRFDGIQLHLGQIDGLERAVAAIEARIGDALASFTAVADLRRKVMNGNGVVHNSTHRMKRRRRVRLTCDRPVVAPVRGRESG